MEGAQLKITSICNEIQQGCNKVATSCKLAFIYFVASSNGRIPELDSGDSSSNLLAIAVVLQPIFKRIGDIEVKKEYIKMPIDQLIPYENNPRKNDEAVPYVEESINQVGYITPIVIDENNVILAGHTRLKALKEKNESEEIEVLKVSGLSDEQKRKYRLLDNKTGEKASWDFSKLEEELADLDFGDFDFGFETDSSDEKEGNEITEDEPPVDVETKCKLGDLWLLGNSHRLICGDSTDVAVIDRLMDGVKAKLLLTDPPYGTTAVEWDCDIDLEKMWAVVAANSQGDSAKLIFTAQPFTTTVINSNAKDFRYEIIWVKTQKTGFYNANRMPLKAHENILVFYSKLPTFNPQKTKVERNDIGRVRNKKADRCVLYGHVEAQDYIEDGTRYPADVIEFSNWNGALFGNNENATVHPTQKPIELLSYLIKTYSNEDDTVFDLFGGSGSTLIACEQLNRKCYMCELDEKYVSVIVNRYLNFTDRKDEIFCIRDGQKLTYDEVFGE